MISAHETNLHDKKKEAKLLLQLVANVINHSTNSSSFSDK